MVRAERVRENNVLCRWAPATAMATAKSQPQQAAKECFSYKSHGLLVLPKTRNGDPAVTTAANSEMRSGRDTARRSTYIQLSPSPPPVYSADPDKAVSLFLREGLHRAHKDKLAFPTLLPSLL